MNPRLLLEHVKPRAEQPPLRQCRRHRLLVHHLSPGDVHKDRRPLHPSEALRGDQPPGLRGEGDAQHDEVALREQRVEIPVRRPESGLLRRRDPATVAIEDLHGEAAGPASHRGADLPHSDDPQRLPGDGDPEEAPRVPPGPGPRANEPVGIRHLSRGGKEQGEPEVGRRVRQDVRRVADPDPAPGRPGHVDVVHPDGEVRHDGKGGPGRVHQFRVHPVRQGAKDPRRPPGAGKEFLPGHRALARRIPRPEPLRQVVPRHPRQAPRHHDRPPLHDPPPPAGICPPSPGGFHYIPEKIDRRPAGGIIFFSLHDHPITGQEVCDMTVNVGINGFGRIGRNFFRAAYKVPRSDRGRQRHHRREDPRPPAQVRLRPRPLRGRHVTAKENALVVNGKEIKVLAEKDPTSCRGGTWASISSSRAPASSPTATRPAKHIAAGAKKVIISAPAKGEDLTVVMGVNERRTTRPSTSSSPTPPAPPTAWPRSPRSSTTSGIKHGLMTTIHAYTNDQRILDLATTTCAAPAPPPCA